MSEERKRKIMEFDFMIFKIILAAAQVSCLLVFIVYSVKVLREYRRRDGMYRELLEELSRCKLTYAYIERKEGIYTVIGSFRMSCYPYHMCAVIKSFESEDGDYNKLRAHELLDELYKKC